MSIMKYKKLLLLSNTRISRNILFWLLFSLFHYYPRQNIIDYFIILAICVVFYGLPIYINNLFLLNQFLLKKKYLVYSILFSALLALTIYETFEVNQRAIKILPFLSYSNPFASSTLFYHSFHILILFLFLALGKLMSDVLQNERNTELLQQQQVQDELESLRSQINPHFLFNALNTIYGMSRRTDQKTAAAIVALSDILRHNLYDSNGDFTSLRSEIQTLKQYVSFLQLRIRNKENISLEIVANEPIQRIRPMLLLPFIENAIKHGLETHKDAFVKISIKLKGDLLFFECVNSTINSNPDVRQARGGIGLKNVKRRLDICYPGNYDLQIKEDENMFNVTLKLNLL